MRVGACGAVALVVSAEALQPNGVGSHGVTGIKPLGFVAPAARAGLPITARGRQNAGTRARVWGSRALSSGRPLVPSRTRGHVTVMGDASSGRPWIARGIQRLVGRGREQGKGRGPDSLPSLSAVAEAVDTEKMHGLMTTPLPMHPQIRTGQLPNGLRYIILPNASPPERFEVHLEVFAGSADELDSQQGMAHLVEHIAYMGSRKREQLFGTGSQTNAYTDFHHTVYFASCPLLTPPNWKGRRSPMLGRALAAVCDVLEAECEESRLEKERAAVLSEMSMVNTIEYRTECHILTALHAENQLSRRFPIGKEELIRSWTREDVLAFHRTHYRPDNVMLYCIGELDVDACEEQIRKTFGHLPATPQMPPQPRGNKWVANSPQPPQQEEGIQKTLKMQQSRHFPPVTHKWSGGRVTEENSLPVMEPLDKKALGRPRVFVHELVQNFQLHMFAKRPIEPMRTLGGLRRAIMKRIALAALQIRLSVNSRTDPPFLTIEFNQLDSAREGCAVCYLDLQAEPSKWKQATKLAVREIRRLGMFGLTQGELERFSSALLTDARQLAAQGNGISNSDQLTFLMDQTASGHIFMDTEQTYQATQLVVESLTLQEVNEVAAEICEHVTLLGVPNAGSPTSSPSAVVACMPKAKPAGAGSAPVDGEGEGEGEGGGLSTPSTAVPVVPIAEEEVLQVVTEGAREELKESSDIQVPESFFTPEELEALIRERKPRWTNVPSSVLGKAAPNAAAVAAAAAEADSDVVVDAQTGVAMRRLSNGVRVNMARHTHESQRGQLRIVVPGGRQLEDVLGAGSVGLGTRTMQEGGAFGGWLREQVELFCIDHLIMVTVDANDEFLYMDLGFPTTTLHAHGGTGGAPAPAGGQELSGMEAAFQVVHQILTGFVWEEDALRRAQQSYHQHHDQTLKSLESSSAEALMQRLSGDDQRFQSVRHEVVDVQTLEGVSQAVTAQLTTHDMEMSLVGDFELEEAERLVLQYVGTVPPSKRRPEVEAKVEDAPLDLASDLPRHVHRHLVDSDDRAVGYVAGSAPNRWGVMRGGGSVRDLFDHPADSAAKARHEHPLFPNVALALLKEVVNRRLFSVVREQKRLTYDANMHLTPFERFQGAWYLISVTANPDKVDQALTACQDTLREMRGRLPITPDNVESAKRVLINRHEGELRTNAYWCDLLAGLQMDCLPIKDMSCVRDYVQVVNSVTAGDLQQLLRGLTTDREGMFTCAGVSGQVGKYPQAVGASAAPFP